MADLELVERLRERADVTYDEAKEALDACDDDLLDAVIYLEKRGKVPPPSGGGSFSSEQGPRSSSGYTVYKAKPVQHTESFSDLIRRFANWLASVLNKSFVNVFEVKKNGSVVFTVPVIILVLLIVCGFWVTVPLLIVGLFFDFRYYFQGPKDEIRNNVPDGETPKDKPREEEKAGSDTESRVNAIIEDVARAADELKNELKSNMGGIGKDKDS